MKNAPPPPFIVDDDLDLRSFSTHLRRGWKLIVAMTAFGTLAGLFLASRIKPAYTVRGVVRIPWTWDLAAREPAALVASALRAQSVSKRRGIGVARMALRDITGSRLPEAAPVQLSVAGPEVERGQRRLEEFLAEANRAPDILKIVEEARLVARQEVDRIDRELASGHAADSVRLIQRRERLQAALDRDSGLGWDISPWWDGLDVSPRKTTIILLGAFFGFLTGTLGALARWPRFMMS